MIFFGTALYGRIDRLSNGWFVATQFTHIYWMPIYPRGTYLVTGDSRGISLPLSGRSILAAYARAGSIAMAAMAILFAAVFVAGRHDVVAKALRVALAITSVGAAIVAARVWRRASRDREASLMRQIEARAISGRLPAARGFEVMPKHAPAATAITTEPSK